MLTFLIWLCTSCKELHRVVGVLVLAVHLNIVLLDGSPPTHLIAFFNEALRCLDEFFDGVHD